MGDAHAAGFAGSWLRDRRGLMRKIREPHLALPNSYKLTIIAQDPSVRFGGRILTAEVDVPAEELMAGPCGYRVNVIDYDATANVLYEPATFRTLPDGRLDDPFRFDAKTNAAKYDQRLMEDPRFHAQNVYAISMRTLARFEFALGRRIGWGSQGHQIHIAPHAFAEPNAFYSREDRGIFFGYFTGTKNQPVYTCLSHDVVAHETTHAILDGLRARYLEPSSPDQAAFHEGFADVVALLSVFSLPGIVEAMLGQHGNRGRLIDKQHLSRDSLKNSALLGLADEFGSELSGIRGDALRRSVNLEPGKPYMSMPGFDEEHERGELLVAAFMNAFLDIWLARIEKIGFLQPGKRDRSIVVEEGARVADHLLTIAIRAIDYCPPTDLTFADYLSALLTIDREVVPDDSKYDYRGALLKNFKDFDISPAAGADADGSWRRLDEQFVYSRTRFDSLLRDSHEVFRFIWENRTKLKIGEHGYIEVQSVRPSFRVGPDGFVLRETVAEYVQILTLEAGELESALKITPPEGLPKWRRVRLFGGGALIFDEYGQLKYQIANHLANTQEDVRRQTERLRRLWENGFFEQTVDARSRFASIHLARATQ
jgi:hypothetical protein